MVNDIMRARNGAAFSAACNAVDRRAYVEVARALEQIFDPTRPKRDADGTINREFPLISALVHPWSCHTDRRERLRPSNRQGSERDSDRPSLPRCIGISAALLHRD